MTNAQSFDHWGIETPVWHDEPRICYYDSFNNLCGLVCIFPREKDLPGARKNAEFVCELFNKTKTGS